MKNKTIPLYLLSLLYFLLGIVHIGLSFLALICMTLPFILLYKNREKTWCKKACPRADYFKKLGKISLKKKMPVSLSSDKARKIVLMYFCINLMLIFNSTLSVAAGRMAPMEQVRFLIAFELPLNLPQIWNSLVLPPVLSHLAYRLYSIMFSSAVLGSIMAVLYKPRSWCVVCPVNTVSTVALSSMEKEKPNGKEI